MFSSATNFRSISCPLEAECIAPNCVFRHAPSGKQRDWSNVDEDTDAVEHQHQRKRQKLETDGSQLTNLPAEAKSDLPVEPKKSKAFVGTLITAKSQSNAPTKPSAPRTLLSNDQKSATVDRAITPPPTRQSVGHAQPTGNVKVESLNPRILKAPPASHATRVLYLKKLHEALAALNSKLIKDGKPSHRRYIMSKKQLISLALDEEERIAQESAAVYANVVKMTLVTYKKMSLEQWVECRQEARASKTKGAIDSKDKTTIDTTSLDTGLNRQQELSLISHLLAKQDGLEKHGYVISVPSEEKIAEGIAAAEMSDGWEKCDRCTSRFQVFPDRRQDGALVTGGTCTYHPSRPTFPPRDWTSQAPKTKFHPCCNEPLGSSTGCDTAPSHVFKMHGGHLLASVMQFAETPENDGAPADRAVSFDCEMGYTTKGMEVIRVTAVAWPSSELLLDVLVKPIGTVLDLNSRFSGVTAERFASAPHYKANPSTAQPQDGQQVQVVESPHVARQIFFDLISPTTPLIGHAIENDLNAMRIVHPCIVDTIILFPLRSGLPLRRSLKGATREFLNRSIQDGGAAGHDSKEDARATGDLVRLKVKLTWELLQRKGWTFEGDKLQPPAGRTDADAASGTEKRLQEHKKRKETAAGADLHPQGEDDSPGR